MASPEKKFLTSSNEFMFSPWVAGLFLLAVTVFFFRDFLSPSGNLVISKLNDDLAGQFVWWRQFGFEELKKGHLALWNPHLYCGEPFFGGFQSALLYPPNWFFMVMPLPFALNFSIALHVFLAGWFTYLWVSSRGSHPASAFMGAFMFMFGASYILHIVPGHLPNLCTMVWIPLVFLAIDQYRKEFQTKWILIGMGVLAIQVFSGHIQYVYYTGVISFIYALFNLSEGIKPKLKFLGGLSLIYIGAVLLSAVQLLAGWAATVESARAQTLDIDFLDIADISPERLWCLLMPDFFGGYQAYWGGGMYHEGAVFVSVTAFVLAMFALSVSKHPQKKFFIGLALGMIVVAVGKRLPFFALFCKYFPLFDRFRGIGKINIFVTLCLIALAAMGMDEIFRNPASLKKMTRGVVWGGLFLFFAAGIFVVLPHFKLSPHFDPFLIHMNSMTLSLLGCGCLLMFLAALAHFSFQWSPLRYGFLLLAMIELLVFASENRPSFDLSALKQEVSAIQRVYDQDPGDYRILTESKNYALGTTGSSIWGDDPTLTLRYNLFHVAVFPGVDKLDIDKSKALGLTRLKYAFTLEQGQLVPRKMNLNPAPRTALVDHWDTGTPDNIIPQLMNPKFDFKKSVWLESEPLVKPVSSSPKEKGQVSLKDISSDAVEVSAQITSPKILVMSDNYSRDWKVFPFAESSQQTYQVMPANEFQMAIPLGPGSHHFILQYRPTAFVIGCWISWISWFLFIGFFFLTVPLTRRPKRL